LPIQAAPPEGVETVPSWRPGTYVQAPASIPPVDLSPLWYKIGELSKQVSGLEKQLEDARKELSGISKFHSWALGAGVTLLAVGTVAVSHYYSDFRALEPLAHQISNAKEAETDRQALDLSKEAAESPQNLQ
jgi:hypothetical protein